MSKPVSALWFACLLFAPGSAAANDACPGKLAQLLGDPAATCQVLHQERLVSDLGNSDVVFRLFRWVSSVDEAPSSLYDTSPYNQVGVTLSLADDTRTEAFWAKHHWLGEGWFEAPYLVQNRSYGEILVVPGRLTGTGGFVDDDLLMPTMGRSWQAIDASQGWVAQLAPHIPEGHHIAKGVLVDYWTFTGETAVWRPDDANCCPSGGRVWFRLELKGPNLSLNVAETRYTLQGQD